MKREIGSVFMTKLMKRQGHKGAQYINAAFDGLTIPKESPLRDADQTGKYALVRVVEIQLQKVDADGDLMFDADGKPVYGGEKIVRNQIEATGSHDEIAEMLHADDLLEASAKDFIAAKLEEMRLERKARSTKAPAAVVKPNNEPVTTEPEIGG